jgi:hypothetical protein
MPLSPEAIELGKALHAHLLATLRSQPATVSVDTAFSFLEERASTIVEQGHGLAAAIAIEHQRSAEAEDDLLQLLYDTDYILMNRQDAELDRRAAEHTAKMAGPDK